MKFEISDLPPELVFNILNSTSLRGIGKLCSTNSHFRQFCLNPQFWKQRFEQVYGKPYPKQWSPKTYNPILVNLREEFERDVALILKQIFFSVYRHLGKYNNQTIQHIKPRIISMLEKSYNGENENHDPRLRQNTGLEMKLHYLIELELGYENFSRNSPSQTELKVKFGVVQNPEPLKQNRYTPYRSPPVPSYLRILSMLLWQLYENYLKNVEFVREELEPIMNLPYSPLAGENVPLPSPVSDLDLFKFFKDNTMFYWPISDYELYKLFLEKYPPPVPVEIPSNVSKLIYNRVSPIPSYGPFLPVHYPQYITPPPVGPLLLPPPQGISLPPRISYHDS